MIVFKAIKEDYQPFFKEGNVLYNTKTEVNKLKRKTRNAISILAIPILIIVLLAGVAAAEQTVRDKLLENAKIALDQGSIDDPGKAWKDQAKGNWDWLNNYILPNYGSIFYSLRKGYGCNYASIWRVEGDDCYVKPDLKKYPNTFIPSVSFYSDIEHYGFYKGIGRGGQCKFFTNVIASIAEQQVTGKNTGMFPAWVDMALGTLEKDKIKSVKSGDVIIDKTNIHKKPIYDWTGKTIGYQNQYYLYVVTSINSGDSDSGTVTSIQVRDDSGAMSTFSESDDPKSINYLPKYKVTKYMKGIIYAKPGNMVFQTDEMVNGYDHAAIVSKIKTGDSNDGTVSSLDVIDSNFVTSANNEVIGYHDISDKKLWKYYVYTGIDYEATASSPLPPPPKPLPQKPSITVKAPNGGETWYIGTGSGLFGTYDITWDYIGKAGKSVKIELVNSCVCGTVYTITSSTPIGTNGKGSYSWTIPSDFATGDYLVRVTSNDDTKINDISNTHFTISQMSAPTPTPTILPTETAITPIPTEPTPTETPIPTLTPIPTETPAPVPTTPIPPAPGTIHNINKDTYYPAIQPAINDSDPGNEIDVTSGVYQENLDLPRSHLILRGIDTGTGRPVIDGGGNGSTITLSSDNITVTGFNVTNASIGSPGSSWPEAGIYLAAAALNSTIEDNTLSGNRIGIYSVSSGNVIRNNSAFGNWQSGILLDSLISNNLVAGNNISSNPDGIDIYYGSYNIISTNNVSGNTNGIGIYYANNNTVTNNEVADNLNTGISLGNSFYNLIYHNNLRRNVQNGYDANLNNSWDNGLEGNYWGDYSGPDSDSNGIGDTAYIIPGAGAEDRYPLTKPFTG